MLLRSNIAASINSVSRQSERTGHTRITWSGSQGVVGELIRSDISAISTYIDWVRHGAYSAMLYDASLIQLSYEYDGTELIKHRLSYIPCPVDVDQDIMAEFPILDVLDLHLAGGIGDVKLRSPVRFDYDLYAGGNDHAASHMTILWSHCRLPVFAALSPGHFIKFVFKNFYPHLWAAQEFLREWPTDLGNVLITPEEQSHLHFAISRGAFHARD